MSKGKFLIFLSLILAVAAFAWSSGNALAQEKANRAVAIEGDRQAVRDQVKKDIAKKGKGKVTISDHAKFFGKATPAEQKAAAKAARQLGLYPGIAGLAVQAPGPGGVAVPARQVP